MSDEEYYKTALITNIKPCPFCASKDISFSFSDAEESVYCRGCGVRMKSRSCGHSVQKWNNRKIN